MLRAWPINCTRTRTSRATLLILWIKTITRILGVPTEYFTHKLDRRMTIYFHHSLILAFHHHCLVLTLDAYAYVHDCRSHNHQSGARNTSAPCYIRCLYDTVLGPGSANSATNPTTAGLTKASLDAMWTSATEACPDVGLQLN